MSRTSMKWYSGGAALVVGLGMLLAGAGGAQAAPQYSLSCSTCHQMPPLDSASGQRDPNTGAFKGNHQAHADAAAQSCVKCHGAQVTSYGTNHRTKAINLNSNVNGSPLGSTYSRGFINQTSVPPATLGSCSNANCHFEAVTPAWGSAAFAAPADCASCHGAAPATGSHPTTGSKHANYVGTGTGSCLQCHPNHLAEAKPFAHATSATSRGIKVQFAGSNASGSYSGTGLNFLPSQSASHVNGSCSNLYCHSDGKGGAPNVVPAWGGALDCKGCHNSDLASGSAMATGKHGAHVNNAAVLGANYGCVECHSKTVSGDTTIANFAKHADGFVDFSGAKAGKQYTTASGVCANVYCHSDGKGTAKDMTANNWKTGAALDCRGCHGSDNGVNGIAGEPNYTNTGAGQPRANSHAKHVTGAADCASCHSSTTTNGTAIAGNHTNGTIDLLAGNGKSFTPGADKTCSNISCHNGGGITKNSTTAQWGSTFTCASCHGNAITGYDNLSTNAHYRHVSLVAGKGYGCASCHAATVSDNQTIVDRTKHANGAKDVSLANFNGTTCSNLNCHSNGKGVYATPTWSNRASGACGTCHATSPALGSALINTNAHFAHFSTAANSYGPMLTAKSVAGCQTCHNYSNDLAANHVNNSVDINGALGYSPAGTGLCTPCHKQTTNWTNSAAVNCQSCHTGALSVINGVTAPDKTLAATAGHGAKGQDCLACHEKNARHINGGTRLQTALTGALNTECKYCHENATKVTTEKFRNMSTHFLAKGGPQAMACSECHDPHGTGNLSQIKISIKGQSISYTDRATGWVNNTSNQGLCQVCHTSTSHYKAGVAETGHYTDNCYNCHNHRAAGGAFKPKGECDSCHGYPPAPKNVAVAFGTQGQWTSAKFEDYSGGGGAHLVAAHISPNARPADQWANCVMCHSKGAASHLKQTPVKSHIDNVTVAVDPQYRFANTFIVYTGAKLFNAPAANETGSCFNVSCHISKSPKWSTER